MNSFTERIRLWYDYEKNCNEVVLKMLRSVPVENRPEPAFQKAIDKFVHAVLCRQLWMFRFGYIDSPPETVFPISQSLDQIVPLCDEVYARWDQYMGELNDDTLASDFQYQSSEGDSFVNSIEEILVHLHGHMMYHRGQVATLVAQCGGTTIDTDLVYQTRRPAPSS